MTESPNKKSVRVLVIAGLEPTGRMGLLADVATIRALGGEALGIASALTAQGTKTFAVEPVAPRMIEKQIRAALEVGPVDAVKLGMLPDRATLSAIRRALRGVELPCVVDPVVRSSSGKRLSSLTARDYVQLAGPRVVITPNVPEAVWLLGARAEAEVPELERVALDVLALGFGGVALKGGHRADGPTDLIAEQGRVTTIRGRAVARGPEMRGTGCRYGSALAVELARGRSLLDAARVAKRSVASYLRAR